MTVVKLETKTLSRDELKKEVLDRIELLQGIVESLDNDGQEGGDLTIRGKLEFDGRKGASHENIEDGVPYGIFGRLTIEYSFDYGRTLVIDNPR